MAYQVVQAEFQQPTCNNSPMLSKTVIYKNLNIDITLQYMLQNVNLSLPLPFNI